jgi:basic membrane protein A
MYEGAKFMDAAFEVEVAYTGDWVDIARNKETAQAMIGRGADVFLAPAGASGIGTIEAADEAGLAAIGYIEDENYRAPDTVITSQLVNFVGIYDQLGELFSNGQLEAKIYPVTIKGGLIELAPFRGRVKEGIEEQTRDIMAQLQSGELEVERVIHDFTR